jgi:hypothetical protein
MTTPVEERPEPTYGMHSNMHSNLNHQRSSDDDGTFVEDERGQQNTGKGPGLSVDTGGRDRSNSRLTVDTEYLHTMQSPSQTREQASRLDDDLAMLQIERQISHQDELNKDPSTSRSMRRQRSRRGDDPIDEFDAATNPLHEKAALYKPPEHPNTSISKFFKRVHGSSFLVRYFVYITPVVLIILIPLLLGALLFKNASVGGVRLIWFSIWLEIVWLSLWAGRVSPRIWKKLTGWHLLWSRF